MSDLSNVSAFAVAINNVTAGEDLIELGVAQIAAAAIPAWNTPMVAVIHPGKSTERKDFFSLSDIYAPSYKDGTKTVDGLVLPARLVALADNFGLGALTASHKKAIKRGLRLAGASMHLGIEAELTDKGALFPIQSVFPVVELVTERVARLDETGAPVLDETGAAVSDLVEVETLTEFGAQAVGQIKGSLAAIGEVIDDETAIAKVKAIKVPVDGKPNPVFPTVVAPVLSEFADAFGPALTDKGRDNFATRAPRNATDKGTAFDDNVKALIGIIKAMASDAADGETDVAPTLDRNTALKALEAAIEDYFASDVARDVVADAIGEANAIREKREAAEAAEAAAAAAAADADAEQPQAPASGRRPRQSKVK